MSTRQEAYETLRRFADRCTWRASRTSGTALVPGSFYGGGPTSYRQPSEIEARRIAFAYEEGAYSALRAVALRLGFNSGRAHAYAIECGPTYHEIRDFLFGDCDVDQRIAQRVAFDVLTARRRYAFDHERVSNAWRGGDTGWI